MPTGIYKRKPFTQQHKDNIGRTTKERLKDGMPQKHRDNISKAVAGEKNGMFGKGHYGEKNGMWKGDNAGILAMHMWVMSMKGKASEYKCIDCGKQAEDWSNKDHSYKRILEDYFPRCTKCHMRYDMRFNNSKFGQSKKDKKNN